VRAPFNELLGAADRHAVGAFTCYDLEVTAAVLGAAAAAGRGVILLLGNASFTAPDGPLLLAALTAAVDASPARACVQLDHCDDLAVIEAALARGAGAVMADGSALPFDENVAFVRRAAELAAAAGAGVECELGGIAGDEDVTEAVAAGALTEPAQAVELVAATGADCLAVSIGNVHGDYRHPPALDWPRLAAIRAQLAVPLSLHGASGLPAAMLAQAIAAGIAKVNVNTELRRAYLAATGEALPGALAKANVAALHAAQTAAVRGLVAEKLAALDPGSDPITASYGV
jgi:tagatose 1,6-diphosphate aldolase GatY/KbaY